MLDGGVPCPARPRVNPEPGASQADQPELLHLPLSGPRSALYERSGTPCNDLSVPTDIVFLVVLWRLRYKLSLRDLAEMFLGRRFVFSHETLLQWEALVAPLLTEQLCTKRPGKAGKKWHTDET